MLLEAVILQLLSLLTVNCHQSWAVLNATGFFHPLYNILMLFVCSYMIGLLRFNVLSILSIEIFFPVLKQSLHKNQNMENTFPFKVSSYFCGIIKM